MPGMAAQAVKSKVALSSVLASALLAAFKLLVGLATNSLGILSEAFHSGIDIIAALATLYAVRVSLRTPDLSHPYGYGKIESLASLTEIVLLFVVAGGVFYEGIDRIFFHAAILDIMPLSFLIILVSIGVDFERSRVLYRVSQRFGSQSLEADSLHFKADMVTSAVVLLGLVGVAFAGVPNADAYAAIAASGAMVYTSLGLGRRTLDVLLDKAPKGAHGQIEELVSGLEGVRRVTNIRVRKVGPRTFVDLHIEVPRLFTNERAHGLATLVEERLKSLLPNSDILVHVDAVETRETISDKIRLIASETEGVKNVHSIYQSRLASPDGGKKLHVYMDVQLDERLDLQSAHDILDRFERRLVSEIPEIGTVTTHEEVEVQMGIGAERRPDQSYLDRIRALAMSNARVVDCRDIAVVAIKGEEHITLTVELALDNDNSISLDDAHRIATEVQTLIMEGTHASRVVAHVEPAGHHAH